jgi:hypothetical protein
LRKILTDALIRALPAPGSGRLEYADTRSSGFALRITAASVKSWSFRSRDPVSGEPARFSIGQYPEVSLADARERADELRRGVAKGENPIERKRHDRAEAPKKTFQYLADRYMTEHARRFSGQLMRTIVGSSCTSSRSGAPGTTKRFPGATSSN